MRCANSQLGIGLLDLLVALSLMSVICALSVPLIQTSYRVARVVIDAEEGVTKEEFALLTISRALEGANGIYSLKTWSVNKVRPADIKPGSDSITVIDYREDAITEVIDIGSLAGFSARILLCDRGRRFAEGEIAEHFLGVGHEGASLIEGRVKQIALSGNGCSKGVVYSGTFKPFSSPLAELLALGQNPSELMEGTQLIIPVNDSFSLYLSNKNELRRLSHISSENQPLVRNLETLLIKERDINKRLLDITISKLTTSLSPTHSPNIADDISEVILR